jgi:PhnB protein
MVHFSKEGIPMKNVNAYLFFNGKAKPAMEFYHKTFGGDLQVITYGQSGQDMGPGVSPDGVMHSNLKGPSFHIMCSDNAKNDTIMGDNITLYIECESTEEVDRLYSALGKGGQPGMKPENTFWGSYFGTLEDSFGINWMMGFEKK